jgi:hypothetical protein
MKNLQSTAAVRGGPHTAPVELSQFDAIGISLAAMHGIKNAIARRLQHLVIIALTTSGQVKPRICVLLANNGAYDIEVLTMGPYI